MTDNFGSAKLDIIVDLQKLIDSAQQAVGIAQNTVQQIKDKFNFAVEGSGFKSASDGIKDTNEAAEKAKVSVTDLGEEGSKAVQRLSSFELIKGTIDGVSQAFNKTKDYVMGFVKDFGTAEQSAEKLKFKLEKIGESAKFEMLSKQATDLMNSTGIDDDDIVNAQAMLVSNKLNADAVKNLTPLVLDLSAAFKQNGDSGMNLQRTAMLLSKTAGEELYQSLGRANIIFSDSEKKQLEAASSSERLDLIMKKLSGSIGGLSERLGGSTLGRLELADNKFKNIRETIGEVLAPVILKITDMLGGLMEVFSGMPQTIQIVVVAIGGIGIALMALAPVMAFMISQLAALNLASGGILLAIGAVVIGLGALGGVVIANIDTIRSWVTDMLGGEEALNALKQAATEIWETLQDFAGFMYEELVNAFVDVKNKSAELWEQFGVTSGGTEKLLTALKNLIKDGIQFAKENFVTLKEAAMRIIDAFQDFIKENKNLADALKFVAEVGFKVVIEYIKGTAVEFNFLIGVIGRVVNALGGVLSALTQFSFINLGDLILNPSKLDEKIGALKNSLENIKEAFTSNAPTTTQTSGFGDLKMSEYSQGEYGFVGPEPPPVKKDTTPGNNTSSNKGSGKDKKQEDNKEEAEALDEIIRRKESQLKLEAATVDEKKALLNEYIAELSALSETLSKTENKKKAEDKLVDVKKELLDIDKNLSEESKKQFDANEKLKQSIDDFVIIRTNKSLAGVQKETAEITKAYDAMYQKITDSKLDATEKEIQNSRLQIAMDKEIAGSKEKFEKQAEEELKNIKLRNSKNGYVIDIKNINDKYDKEEKRIKETYAEGKTQEELLHQLKIAKQRDLQGVQTEGQKNIMQLITGGWQTVMSEIQAGFSQVWTNIFGEANTLFEKFFQYVSSKLLELAASELFSSIIDVLSGGVGGFLGDIFGGLFAEGGDVNKDKMYVVGEKGPELFIPKGDGHILSNENSKSILARNLDAGKIISDIKSGPMNMMRTLGGEIENMDISAQPGSVMYNVHLGGVNTKVSNRSLRNLSQSEWSTLIDKEMLPQISQALKRIGKEVVDDKIKPR